MVWIQVEVVGDADEVIRLLGYLGGRGDETVRIPDGRQVPAPATGQYRAEANPAPESGAGGRLPSATVGRLDGGVGRRLHGEPGRRGQADDAPRLAGRRKRNPSERPVSACGADAGGVALVADADGPRAGGGSSGSGG